MSKMSEQHVKVSIVPGGVPPRVYLKQYDTGLSALKLHVYDENNEPYTIETDTVVSFKGNKIIPGGTSYILMYDCTFTDNVVSVTVPLQLTLESGEINCELRFVDENGNSKGSIAIILEVEKGVPEYGAVISGSDIAYANDVLTKLQQEYGYNEMINRSPYKFKGTVSDTINLPKTGNTVNDTYYVISRKYSVSWNGSVWSQSSFNENSYIQTINEKISKPTSNPNGNAGQILRSNGNGTTSWVEPSGAPTDGQVSTAVTNWLEDNPEALHEYTYVASSKTFVM